MVPDGSEARWHYTGYAFVKHIRKHVRHAYVFLHGEAFRVGNSNDFNACSILNQESRADAHRHTRIKRIKNPRYKEESREA